MSIKSQVKTPPGPDRETAKLMSMLHELKKTQDHFDTFKTSCMEKIGILEKEIILLKESQALSKQECKRDSVLQPALRLRLRRNIHIPGLQYVLEGRRRWVHGLLWVFIHVVALLISHYYIQNAYDRWQSSPTIQSLTNTLTNVSDVPFPAVTYCVRFALAINHADMVHLRTKCLLSRFRFKNVSIVSENCTKEEDTTFLISSLFVPSQPDRSFLFNNTEDIDENTFFDTINRIVKTDSLIYNSNLGEYVNFLDNQDSTSPPFFLNDEFVCKTYNGLHYKSNFKDNVVYYLVNRSDDVDAPKICEWNPDKILNPTCDGGKNGLSYTNKSLVVKIRIAGKTTARQPKTVWRDEQLLLSVHNPATIPTIGNLEYIAFSTRKDVDIYIIPKLIVPEKDFYLLKPSTKGCLFSHERKLSMFKFYSQQNCLLECRLNCTVRKCGCITFNQPRFNTTNICGKPKYRECLTGIWCGHCDCLPDCVSLDYGVQVKEHGLLKNIDDRKGINFRLSVAYRYNAFSTTLRHSINSVEEFIAYSAGILGVFNGFSLMALWEVLYLLALRLWTWATARR